MKLLIVILMSFVSTAAFAAETCENYAKYFSIRDYKSRVGVVQGSEGIQYEAKFISTLDTEHTFQVTIYDNNEDGDTWAVVYDVVVAEIPNSNKCSLVELKATDLEE